MDCDPIDIPDGIGLDEALDIIMQQWAGSDLTGQGEMQGQQSSMQAAALLQSPATFSPPGQQDCDRAPQVSDVGQTVATARGATEQSSYDRRRTGGNGGGAALYKQLCQHHHYLRHQPACLDASDGGDEDADTSNLDDTCNLLTYAERLEQALASYQRAVALKNSAKIPSEAAAAHDACHRAWVYLHWMLKSQGLSAL